MYTLKGPCHEIFDLRFFHQTIPSGPLTHGLKPFCIFNFFSFVSAEIFDYEIDFFVVSGVNDTADHWWAKSMTPLTGCGRCQ
jgi:hypothetical protein